MDQNTRDVLYLLIPTIPGLLAAYLAYKAKIKTEVLTTKTEVLAVDLGDMRKEVDGKLTELTKVKEAVARGAGKDEEREAQHARADAKQLRDDAQRVRDDAQRDKDVKDAMAVGAASGGTVTGTLEGSITPKAEDGTVLPEQEIEGRIEGKIDPVSVVPPKDLHKGKR